MLLLHLGLCALYLHGFGSGLAGLSQHDRLVRFAVIVPGPGPTTATGIPLALGLLGTFRPMFDFIGSLIEHWCIFRERPDEASLVQEVRFLPRQGPASGNRVLRRGRVNGHAKARTERPTGDNEVDRVLPTRRARARKESCLTNVVQYGDEPLTRRAFRWFRWAFDRSEGQQLEIRCRRRG